MMDDDDAPRTFEVRTTGPLAAGEAEARRVAADYFGGAPHRLVRSHGGRDVVTDMHGTVLSHTYICDWEFEVC